MIFLDFRAKKPEISSTTATAAGGLTFTGRIKCDIIFPSDKHNEKLIFLSFVAEAF